MVRLLATLIVLGVVMVATPAAAVDGPTSAAGYARMFARVVAQGEAGAGDVSLSAPLPDGRVVWLYGDTFSERNGMVRSSAIVQTGKHLHVSHHGEQVLPNGPRKGRRSIIYWIEAATAISRNTLAVTAAPMSVGKANGWDFHRANERSRVARIKVSPAGDVRFTRWMGWVEAPAPFADFAQQGAHLTYEHRAHPWAVLANDQTLMTHANNWDLDGFKTVGKSKRVDYAAYAPTYYAGDGIERKTQ